MVLGGGTFAPEKKRKHGTKGTKLSKAERQARKEARLTAAQASFSLQLEPPVMSSLRQLTAAGKIEQAEKAAHASLAPGLAVAEILRTIATEKDSSFRAATAAHVCRRFAARCPEAATVLASLLVPEQLDTKAFECAAVRMQPAPTSRPKRSPPNASDPGVV